MAKQAHEPSLKRIAIGAVLLLPAFFFYARAIADALLSSVAVLFLLRSHAASDWCWLRRPWVPLAGLLWLLILIASISTLRIHASLEALVMIRLLIFCAALEAWVLTEERTRRWLGYAVALAGVWLIIQAWQQLFTGANIFGDPRWPDGALTGPFFKPRAGPQFHFVFFAGLMPFVIMLIQGQDRLRRIAGGALLALMVVTMILIGQRMPNLLMLLGLAITALVVRQFRKPALIAFALGVVLLLLLPVISPPTEHKLVLTFSRQMSRFLVTPYGHIYTRAAVMTAAHPWLGLGFEGFRDFCSNPVYFHGLPALGIPNADNGGLRGCNIHPHNYYLEIATCAGLPGLAIFCVLVLLWLGRMLRALSPSNDARQAMLFVACCTILWPIASTSSLFTLSTAGWVFMTIGWGLAASNRVRPDTGELALAGSEYSAQVALHET